MQLYEGWALANFKIAKEGVSVTDYLHGLVEKMAHGWEVDFGTDKAVGIESQVIKVSPDRLLVGLANGWTEPYPPVQKFLLLWPEQVQEAYEALPEELKPRGFMFWDIEDEGNAVGPNKRSLFMAKGLNSFLHTRGSGQPPRTK